MNRASATETRAWQRLAEPLGELAACERLLAEHIAVAVGRFGAAALGVIDLPPLATAPIEPAQLRAAAALFWAMQMEEAGLPSFAEKLAEGVMRGTLLLPITSAGTRLGRYYQERREHLSPMERQTLYQRVFDREFALQLARLVDALSALGRSPDAAGLAQHKARIAVAARELASLLSARAVGIVAFAARDITQGIRQAIEILSDQEVNYALGGRDLWSTLRIHGPEVVGRVLEPERPRTLASAGQRILAWLADSSSRLHCVNVDRNAPVIDAAEVWLAATRR